MSLLNHLGKTSLKKRATDTISPGTFSINPGKEEIEI